MQLSRVRLRIAAGFALAFTVSLGVLAAGALGYLWQQSHARLDARLSAARDAAVQAFQREFADTPDSSLTFVAGEVIAEWPANDDPVAIVDARCTLLAGVKPASATSDVVAALNAAAGDEFPVRIAHSDYRAIATPVVPVRVGGHAARIRAVAFASAEGIESDAKLLGGALAIVTPLLILLSLVAGYALAGRALRPAGDLRDAMRQIAPTDLSQRLPVREPRDEIGALAAEFNGVLARLAEAQSRNRRFLREAAHQIRTPLTLVLGEAGNALGGASGDADARAALPRIRTAAEQMRRRVDDLFLLAEAQSGEPVRLDDDVELDGLAFECTDLMRSRATSLGRSLALGRTDHMTVRGNARLLQEAVVELIENGCRHGTPDEPVTVSVEASGAQATIAVASGGDPIDIGATDDVPEGLGIPIVRWIAKAHGGELRIERQGERNAVSLALPARTQAT